MYLFVCWMMFLYTLTWIQFFHLSVNCWPSVSGNETYVSMEYEASSMFDLQNVVISIPLPALREAPNVKQVDGEWRWKPILCYDNCLALLLVSDEVAHTLVRVAKWVGFVWLKTATFLVRLEMEQVGWVDLEHKLAKLISLSKLHKWSQCFIRNYRFCPLNKILYG